MDKKLIPERTKAAVDHMLRFQALNRLDANRGRTLCAYNSLTGEESPTTSWETGIFLAALLAMYKRTGEKLYLDRAELAGRFIMSLQVMDSRDERYFGVIRECTPQSLEFCPRDATTAAWSLVWLYEATGDRTYLDRAVLFGNWHLKYGMSGGWPLWAVFMDSADTKYYARGSFQSGTGLFYHDLFLFTGDPRYIEQGLRPIADTYIRDFIRGDGSLINERGGFDNREQSSERKANSVELDMHAFNDDFGAQMLMAAADLFRNETYRDSARKFALWLAAHQRPDGNFFNGRFTVSSAVPIALMYYDELGRFYHDSILLAAAEKTFRKLLDMQLLDADDPKLHGAFEGMPSKPGEDPRKLIQMRTNAYSVIALLKAEGKTSGFWLGGEHNRKFEDPLIRYSKQPYPFKW